MRKLPLLLLLSAVAFAGTRWKETAGTLPTLPTDGVSLVGVTVCRGSVRFTDGGAVTGGKLVPMYYDSVLKWVEAKTSDQCSLATDTLIDAGTRRTQMCEWNVGGQYGRASVVPLGLTPQVRGIVRLECFGPDVPASDGGAQ